MKFKQMMVVVLAVLFFALVFGAVLNAGGASAQGFGNLEAQLRHLADQDTTRFMDALRVAFLTLDGPTRTAFKNTLVMELGLSGFATDQEKIKELSQIRDQLNAIADNGDALMVDILANIEITPEPVEDLVEP